MKRKLEDIYVEMYSKNEITPIMEQSERFPLNDYTKVVYKNDDIITEGKSGHGDEKIIIDLLKDSVKKGLITVKETKNGWLVKSVNTQHQELIHRGEKSFHYLRRFLNKLS